MEARIRWRMFTFKFVSNFPTIRREDSYDKPERPNPGISRREAITIDLYLWRSLGGQRPNPDWR